MQVYLKVKIKSLAAEAVIIRKEENKARQASKGLKVGERKSRRQRRILNEKYPLTDELRARREKARRAWFGLCSHRMVEVRSEARSAQLAYGFLRGVPYRAIEAKCWEEPSWDRVVDIILKFGPCGGSVCAMTKADRALYLDKLRDDVRAWAEDTSFVCAKSHAANESQVAP
jgi:hypothetical protein